MKDANKDPRLRQGRSEEQIESNYKILEWTFLSTIAFGVIYSIGKALAIW